MNKTVKIFAGAAVLASFAACSQKIDFETFDYARLEATSYTFNEDAGTVTIPVYANKGASGTVNFEIIETSAKVGTDFTVEPANGSLNINNGGGAITVNIVYHKGELTGDLTFGIRLTGTSDGLTLGGIYAATVKIKDIDHPLTELFGDYTFSGVSAVTEDDGSISYSLPSWTMTMSPVDGNLDQVYISNITAFSVAYASYLKSPMLVVGTVSSDKKTITIDVPQTTTASASGFGDSDNFVLYAHGGRGGEYITDEGVITFTKQDDGSWVTTDSYGVSTPTDILEYPELFLDYAVVASNFNPSQYKTYFIKK